MGVLHMYKSYLRYFIGFFVAIALIVILIVLLFGGGSKSDKNTGNFDGIKNLQDISDTDSAVKMIIAGNVRADQEYHEVHVTVNREGNNIDIIDGYQGHVASSQGFESNQEAYETFLRALQKAGYTKGDSSNKKLADDRGFCPLGLRYIFEITENGKLKQRYWTTSCGKSTPHTFLGQTNLVTTLFERQIPEYSNLTSDVDF